MNINKLRGPVLLRKQARTPPPLNVESILQELAAIRASIPYLEDVARPGEDGLAHTVDGLPLEFETIADFEFAVLEDALTALAEDFLAAVTRAEARAKERARQANSTFDPSGRDPEHEAFMKLGARMRELYESCCREAIRRETE
jgi:hypothetical protein